jgi:hypothetical protein
VKIASLLVALLPVSFLACSQSEGPLSAPTALNGTTALAVCGIEITSFALDVDLSGPYVLVSMSLASPQPVQFEMERYLATGGTEPAGGTSSSSESGRIDAANNTRYRVRGRPASCGEWSDWADVQVGPANPCGGCAPTNPVPPTPPAPPVTPPPPSRPDDDQCRSDDDDHDAKDGWKDHRRRRTGGKDHHGRC